MDNKVSPGEHGSTLCAGPSAWRRWAVWVIVGLAAVAGGTLAFWWWPSGRPPVQSVSNEIDEWEEPVAHPDPGYLGPRACAACHAKRVAEFQTTNHYRACRLPEATTMAPGFTPGKGTFRTHDPSLRFEMTRKDSDFFQTSVRSTPMGEQQSSAHIDLVYGTSASDEVFLSWRGDRLYELPLVWLHPQKQWGASPFNPHASGDFARAMKPRCLECHNTWFEHVAGTTNQYQPHHFLLGVTCERCHRPGRDHVTFHQAHPQAHSPHAVVRPALLSRALQIDLCGQCHSNAAKYRGPAFSYRPGQPVEAHYKTLQSKHPEEDHVANQVKYLRQSKCFQKSDTLTCTTCHNPHRPKQTGPAESGRSSCLKCHSPAHCAEQQRLPEAVRGNCVGCHMPKRDKIQVSFDTEDDEYVPPVKAYEHRIGIYPAARQQVLLAWHRTQSGAYSREETARLTGSLVKHWLAEAEKCRGEYRFLAASAALREALRLDPSPDTRGKLRQTLKVLAKLDNDLATGQEQLDERRFPKAIETFKAILKIKPDLAKAHGKLGSCYAETDVSALAVQHLQAVARYDPDDAYGYVTLGGLAFQQGKAEEAVAAFSRANEIEPFNAVINYHWGLSLAKLGRWAEAGERFRQVLTIDPNHSGGCVTLAQALRQQGQPAEALRFAHRAAQLSRFQDGNILVVLAESYLDAGRPAEAEKTATQALEAAQRGDPKRVPQIRGQLLEIRARAKRDLK